MKKIISILICLITVFSLGAVTVSASEATDITECRKKSDYADYFFDGLNVQFVVNYVSGNFVNEDDEAFNNVTMTHPYNADIINKFLSENFVLSNTMLEEVKKELGYDADTDIYNLPLIGGFGGFDKPREYVSYVKIADKTYSLYYQTIDWLYLPDSEYKKYEEANNWPEEVKYNGKIYKNSAGGYVCKNGYSDGGLVHTFDFKNGNARFISTEKYTGNKVPTVTKPSDKDDNKEENKDENTSEAVKDTESVISKPNKTVTQTDGLLLEAIENTFDKDTVVKAEKIQETTEEFKNVTTALKSLTKKFVAYEVTAVKNNSTVQPDGTVTAIFDIPADFDTSKTVVFYVSNDGKTEELKTKIDSKTRKATATLEHFSTYVVAEKITKPANDKIEDNTDNNDTPISPLLIVAIIIFVLAVAVLVALLFIKFKKNKY